DVTTSSRLNPELGYLLTTHVTGALTTRPLVATRTHEVFGSDEPCCLAFRQLAQDAPARPLANGGVFLHVVAEDYHLGRLGLTRGG
ncbi:MAG: hypothetical protein KGJ10_09375, partial [Acidobacteriota bacterium]|nr:hypothetical protein [Acidobacteriota bacterium]